MTKNDRLVLIGIILFTLLFTPAKAQQNTAEIKGTVVESTSNEALEDALVRLLSSSDSTMQAVVAAGIDGSFELNDVSEGTYLLLVSYIGFEPVYQPLQITADMSSVDVGTVEMEEGIIYLDEVVVTANIDDVRRFARQGRMPRRYL